jgi:hypothetical protein
MVRGDAATERGSALHDRAALLTDLSDFPTVLGALR